MTKKGLRVLDGARFDYDRTRFCLPSHTGFACYRGMRDASGDWQGTLVGLASSESDAQRFLDGSLVRLQSA